LAAETTSPTPLVTKTPEELVAILKSDVGRKQKADACRELAVVGGSSAVLVLVRLLADEQMSDMARYALESMPGATVDAALRGELTKLHGRPLIGVIGSLGVRRDIKSVKPLAALLRSTERGAEDAAARALGSIGTADAAKAIHAAVPVAAAASSPAFYEGLFRCAEHLTAGGKSKQAGGIYDQIRLEKELPAQARVAALRGAILSRGARDLGLLKESLNSHDYLVFTTAVGAALELPGVEVTKALVQALPQLAADNQSVVMAALSSRRQIEALPALELAAKSGPEPTRAAAVHAIAAIGHPSAVLMLMGLLESGNREVTQAALDGLAGIPGPQADGAALDLLSSKDAARELTGIDLAGRRRMTSALPTLMQAASSGEAKVRAAALRRVGELGGPNEVPGLLESVLRATNEAERDAGAEALKNICLRAGKPESLTEQVAAALANAPPVQKPPFLSVLSALGGTEALAAVRITLQEPDPEVRNAAVRALADWPDAAAAPDLMDVVRSPSEEAQRVVAFRSVIRMARERAVPADEKLKILSEIELLARDSQDKKLVLSALGEVTSVTSLRLTAAYFSDPLVADEAGAAAVKIAEKLDVQDKDMIGLVLQQVLKTSNSEPVLASARKRLEKLGISRE
jgi:HEAT repeat protein